jgi:histidinol-phosphate aminotransferase
MSRFFDLVTPVARETKIAAPDQHVGTPSPTEIIRLDSNENPFGPSPRAVEAIRRALSDSHRYPDNNCAELRTRLSELHEFPVEQILVGAGSTQVISLICHTLLGPGLNAVTSERSFIVYGMAVRATGAQLIEVPMRDNGVDVTAVLGRINPQTRIVLLANPNNPTGTMVGAAEVDQFLAEVPSHVVVVLDEAYHDFAKHFGESRRVVYSQSLRYVRQGANVVVLRTFSKAHGLAGLRIGYGVGPAELLAYCARLQDMYSVSSVAQAAALAALDDADHVAQAVSNNAEQAQTLAEGLAELGVTVEPTWANFLYCDLAQDASSVAQRLLREGIGVRPLRVWGAPTCLRVSIGKPEQNRRLLEAMHKLALP